MSFITKISTPSLIKVAVLGGLFVGGNGFLMRWLIHRRFRESPYFLLAKDKFLQNPAVVDLFGEPIVVGTPNLTDSSRNFCTDSEAKFEVPVTGSKQEGMMYFTARKSLTDENATDSPSVPYWQLNSLEITVKEKPNHKLVLVK